MTFFVSNAKSALRKEFLINGAAYTLIIDSGASCCLINRNYLQDNLIDLIDNTHTIDVRGVNGITKTLGTLETFIEYKGYEYPITFHVVDTLPPNIKGLLGTNFLQKFDAKVNFANSELILRVPKFEENFQIPPRTEVITFIKTDLVENQVVLNQQIQPHVYIANAIVTPVNGKIPIRIINIKNKSVKLTNFTPILKPASNYAMINIEKPKDYDTMRAKALLEELNLSEISDKDKPLIQRLCLKYNDVFCLKNDKLTVTKIYQPSLTVKMGVPPSYVRPYKLPQVHKEEVQKQVDKMLKQNIIENSISEWNSPLLLVPKKSTDDTKKWRLVIDYRKLNDALQDDKFPLPNIEEVIDSLSGAKYFSHLDLSQGYYQCEIKPEDRPITAFSTSQGQYQMTRLPMGLKVSPSTFSRLMTVAMTGLNMEKCLVYLDDIIVFGKTLDQHNKNLSDIFERLRQTNLKLNPQKCNFLKTELLYLGHLVSMEGIKPDPSKIEIIKQWSSPQTADEVKRFVAFANYYRKHIKNFALHCNPLNKLTRKSVEFVWTEECEHSFQYLKKCFVNPPVLDYPDFSDKNTFTLHTDASGNAIGAVLSNLNSRPIAFASKALNKAEANYSTIEKELLALVWAIRHFRPYLYGRKFDVYTDHRPLVYLFTLTDPSSRLTKFRLALEEYNFEVMYKKGSENVVADALSRISIEDLKALTPQESFVCTRAQSRSNKNNSTESANNKNKTNNKIKSANDNGSITVEENDINYIKIEFGSKNELLNDQGILMVNPKTSLSHLRGVMERIVKLAKDNPIKGLVVQNTPTYKKLKEQIEALNIKGMPPIIIIGNKIQHVEDKSKQLLIINDFHMLPTAGHAGIRRTINTIKQRYYWNTVNSDVENFVKKCDKCQRNKDSRTKQLMKLTTTASYAFEKVFLDLVGPMLPDTAGNQYILTTQCDLTKYITATPIRDKSTDVVAKAFVDSVILNFGIPKQILTDRGTEFMSTLFVKICKLLEVEKLNSTAYHHQTIGALENSHKVLGNFLRIQTKNSYGNWSTWVPYYKFAYNTTVHSATGKTPHELVFGRICTLPSNLQGYDEIDPVYNIDDYSSILKFKIQTSQKEAKEKLINEKTKRINKSNQNIRQKTFKKGQKVLIRKEVRTKLDTKYEGPFEVVEDLDANIKIKKINDEIETIHKDRIKIYQ